MGVGKGLTAKRHKGFSGSDESVLKLDCGDDCTSRSSY